MQESKCNAEIRVAEYYSPADRIARGLHACAILNSLSMSTFLTAEWRKLIMAQYEVPPELLAPYIPQRRTRSLPTHSHLTTALLRLARRFFLRPRPRQAPRHPAPHALRRNQPALLRPRAEPDGAIKRGVVFIREFVPHRAIAWVARTFYDEPYLAIPTRHEISSTDEKLTASYAWKLAGRWHTLSATASSQPQPIAPASEEGFLTEHYWGYTKRRDGSTSVYQVEHPHWQTYRVTSHQIAVDFAALYGPTFAFLNHQPIASVLLAEGSAITVRSHTLQAQ